MVLFDQKKNLRVSGSKIPSLTAIRRLLFLVKPLESGSTRCQGKEAVGEKWWEKFEHFKMDYHVPICSMCFVAISWGEAPFFGSSLHQSLPGGYGGPQAAGAGPELKIPKSMVLNKCVHIYIWTFIRIYIYIYICTYVHYIAHMYVAFHAIPFHHITLHCHTYKCIYT